MTTCPKCKQSSGNDWSQCGKSCPMPDSPRYKKPSLPQFRALNNIVQGHPAHRGISGRSAHGGFYATLASLRDRGWLDHKGDISDLGRQVVARFLGK